MEGCGANWFGSAGALCCVPRHLPRRPSNIICIPAFLPPPGMAHAATLCYICGGDVDAAVRQWGKAAAGKAGEAPSVDTLEVRAGRAALLGKLRFASQFVCGLWRAAAGRWLLASATERRMPGWQGAGGALLSDGK